MNRNQLTDHQPPKPSFTLPLLEWVNIPAGQVTLIEKHDSDFLAMSHLRGGTARWNTIKTKTGMHTVAPFAIAKYPVTNTQFQAFINDDGYSDDQYWQRLARREKMPNSPKWSDSAYPRENVNWYEAIAFSRWLSAKTGLAVTLPTEMQWQWAAVGDKGWNFPYGDVFDKTKTNTGASELKRTTPVDHYPQGASPFGVLDMSGNVWEWCLNEYDKPLSLEQHNRKKRVLRGGSWDNNELNTFVWYRFNDDPNYRENNTGFRVCVSSHI